MPKGCPLVSCDAGIEQSIAGAQSAARADVAHTADVGCSHCRVGLAAHTGLRAGGARAERRDRAQHRHLAPVGGWLIEWLARDREPSVEFGPGDAWFERALQIWLFPLGLALIAEPVAGSLSAERPEAVTFAAMAAGILVWVMAVLEPRAKLRQAHDQLPRSHRVLGRPLTAMVLGYAGGAILVAVPTYISNVVHDVAWTYLNSSLVVVAAFLGSLLSLTRREATMPDSFTMQPETGSVNNDS